MSARHSTYKLFLLLWLVIIPPTQNTFGKILINLQHAPLQYWSSLLELFQGKLCPWVKTASCSETGNSFLQTSLYITASNETYGTYYHVLK